MSSVWIEAPRGGVVARARVATRAHIEEIERAPVSSLLPAWTILGALEVSAAAFPNKPAIIALERDDPTRISRRISYSELLAMVRAAANRLRAVSGTSQPVVSILTPLVPEALIASWAGATAGIANPINPFLRIDHVAAIMNAARATVLVCGGEAHGPGAWSRVSELQSLVPTLRAVWVIDEAAGVNSLQRQIAAATADRLEFEAPREQGVTAALFHTGGTTSAPKLVQQTQHGQLLNAWCCGAWLGSGSDAMVAAGMPYFHVAGAMCTSLKSIVFGQTMVLVGPEGYRSPTVISRYWDLVETHGVTSTVTTPTTAAALVAAWKGQRAPAGYAHAAGGSAVPIQVGREFLERFGVSLHEVWGMTELHGALIGNPVAAEPRLGSIGLPFPYHRIRCVTADDADAGAVLAPNTLGLLAVSGPCVTTGYLDHTRNRELFLETDSIEQRWLNTGDLGRIEADGAVWLQGRAKDLIIRGGHNIDPLVIEAALISHPAVLHAAAVGEPDCDKGELPVAYVQLRPTASASEAELLAHCQREIAERAAVPRFVRVIETMPLTAVGKIFKPQLRLDAAARCVRNLIAELGSCETVEAELCDSGKGLSVFLKSRNGGDVAAVARVHTALERYTLRVEVVSNT